MVMLTQSTSDMSQRLVMVTQSGSDLGGEGSRDTGEGSRDMGEERSRDTGEERSRDMGEEGSRRPVTGVHQDAECNAQGVPGSPLRY